MSGLLLPIRTLVLADLLLVVWGIGGSLEVELEEPWSDPSILDSLYHILKKESQPTFKSLMLVGSLLDVFECVFLTFWMICCIPNSIEDG